MRWKDIDEYIQNNKLLQSIPELTSGVYCITIDTVVVYIGMSKDVKQRCKEHIYNIENAILNGEQKYKLLLAAKLGGHDIGYYLVERSENNKKHEREVYYITTYHPILNIQNNGVYSIDDLKIEDVINYVNRRLQEEEDTMTREEMYCELINYAAGDYLDTLTDAEMEELYLELFEKGYLA